MIPAFLYQSIYLIVIMILTIPICERFNNMALDSIEIKYPRTEIILAIFLILFIGNRPLTFDFGDTLGYAEIYPFFKSHFSFNWNTENLIFDNFLAFSSNKGVPLNIFFIFIAALYFGLILLACRKMFPQHSYMAFLVYLGAFSTFSYATNGIKAGVAASAFLIAIAYKENKWLSILSLIISYGFHHSMMAPITIYILALLIKNPKYYLYVWIACLLIAALQITYFQELFAGLTDEKGAGYLRMSRVARPVSGFRPDFILYSAVPIFIGYYIMKKCDDAHDDYKFIWNVYTGTNALFLLCTYGSYINRIAYLSWLLYPIVLIYPYIHIEWDENQYKYLRYVIFGHLGFTLFMDFVYYGI